MRLFSTARMAGLLLILSCLLLALGVAQIASEGKLRAMTVAFTGIGSLAKDASGLRTFLAYTIPSLIAMIAGLALFAAHQYKSADGGLALAGLSLAIFALGLAAVEGSFHASVTVWAARQAPTLSTIAPLYGALRRWMNSELQLTYVSAFLSAMAFFSISALRTPTIPLLLRWLSFAWSLFAFFVYFRLLAAPAIIYISPLILGAGLLFARSGTPQPKPDARPASSSPRAA